MFNGHRHAYVAPGSARASLKESGGFIFLTASEMAEADKAVIEEFGIGVAVLMEHAGERVAELARRTLGDGKRMSVVCMVGKGNNGGDGLVAARHLRNWGVDVKVVLGAPREDLRELPAAQLKTVERMGIPVAEKWKKGFDGSDLLVDALLGYNSKGDPREPVAGLIRRANESGAKVVAIDLPSGLDASSGAAYSPCVVASATVSLGWPKTGFLNPGSRHYLGELYVGDISAPSEVYRRYSGDRSVFERGSLVRVW